MGAPESNSNNEGGEIWAPNYSEPTSNEKPGDAAKELYAALKAFRRDFADMIRIAAILVCVVLLPSSGHADCLGFFNSLQTRDCETVKALIGCGVELRDAVTMVANRRSTEVYIVQIIAKCAVARANAAARPAAPNAPPVDAHDWNSRVFSFGYHAGVLRWSQDHCNGSVRAGHIQILHNVRDLDPSKFDAASALGYKESVELAAQYALEAPDANDAERSGSNLVCAVTEQLYGPHGARWIGAWIPPQDRPTAVK